MNSRSLPLPQFLPDMGATLDLGAGISRLLEPGDVVALVGDLGAGKTTLTQGMMNGLGYREAVTSPTFSLVQEYRGGALEVYHFDFYRVEDGHELVELGWDDYLDRGGVVIVEWPGRFPDLVPGNALWLELSHEGEGRRVRVIEAPSP